MKKSINAAIAAKACSLCLLGVLTLCAAIPAIGAAWGPQIELTVVSEAPGFQSDGKTYYGSGAAFKARLVVPEGLALDMRASSVAGTGVDAVATDAWAEAPHAGLGGVRAYEAPLSLEEAVSGARAHVVACGEDGEQVTRELVSTGAVAIDDARPMVDLRMSEKRAGSDGKGVDYYAEEGLACELTIEDETFDANKVLVNDVVLDKDAWSSEGSRHSTSIDCDEARCILVEATDGVGNTAIFAYGDPGTLDAAGEAVDGSAFAVDSVAPRVSSNLTRGDGASTLFTNEAEQKVSVRVSGDGLFEETGTFERLSVFENGRPAEGWGVTFVRDDAGRRSEAVLSKAFADEGSYDIAVTLCKTWCKCDLAAGTLVIDRSAPRIDVAWENAEPVDGSYVTSPQRATVTVEDEHCGGDLCRDVEVPEGAVVAVDASDPRRAIVSFPSDGLWGMRVSVADLAGNTAAYDSPAFTVDTSDPVVSVEWSGPEASPYSSAGLEFFAGRRTATIRVEEENFDRSLVKATGAGGSALALEWTDERTARVSFAAEGLARLRVEAADLAGRAAQPYESRPFVVDATAPRVSVVFDGAADPSGAYLSRSIGATITVEEMNFDESLLDVATTGDEGSVSDVSWSIGADGSHVGRVSFSNSASAHAITVAGVDLAGNKAQVTSLNGATSELYTSGDFYVDDEAPVVSLALSAPPVTAEDGVDYFDAPLTVTVTVVDDHFDASASSLSLPAGVSFESAWRQSPDDPRSWQKVVTFGEGQDQVLEASVCDLAGNEPERMVSQLGYGPFVVDQTAPVASVSFDNDDAHNAKYYNAPRTASVVVADKNFDESRVHVETNGTLASWRTVGDAHTLLVSFASEGAFNLCVTGADKCGNQMSPYTADEFVIDLTAPVIAVEGVADGSAYNGAVAPRLVFSDEANPDASTIAYSVTGAKRGAVDCAAASADASLGRTVTLADFPHDAANDDVYTLEATMSDLAGNESRVRATFSVNRFGSTFRVVDAEAFEQGGGYLASPCDVVIEEVNVSGSELGRRSVSITRDLVSWSPGLTERAVGKGFTVEEVPSGGDIADAWSVCRYIVPAANFDRDGTYHVAVGSDDRAGNTNASTSFYDPAVDGESAAEARFVLDTIDPVVSGLTVQSGEDYQTEGVLEARFTASDNMGVASVDVLLDGQQVPATADGYGGYTFDIGPSDARRSVEVRATDRCGRSAVARASGFRVTDRSGETSGVGAGIAAAWLIGIASTAVLAGWALRRSATSRGRDPR